ncbi:unnamed protein product [Mortierella alpina]
MPALSFSYSSANVHPAPEAPSTPPSTNAAATDKAVAHDTVADSPVSDNGAASFSTPSAHKRRLIVESDDEGQSDPGLSVYDYEYPYDNLSELNLINQVLGNDPARSMSPAIDTDPRSDVAAAAVAEPSAALVGADQDHDADRTTFPANMTIKLHFRRGEPLGSLRSIRDWPSPMFTLRKSDSYRALMTLLQQHIDELRAKKPENRGLVWPNMTPYVQPTSSTNQQHYRPISAENYDLVLAAAWRAERRRLGAGADIIVKMYVYLKDTAKSTSSFQRSVQAQPRVEEANRASNMDRNVGDIPLAGLHHELRQIHETLALLATRIASGPVQPDRGDHIAVPQSAPNRPAELTDEERIGDRSRQATDPAPQERHGMIRIKLFSDQWVPVMIDIGDMRRALGLTLFDISGRGEQQLDPSPRAPLGPEYVIDLDHEEAHDAA